MDAVMKHPRPNRVMRECTARRFTLGIVRPHTSASSREKKRICVSTANLTDIQTTTLPEPAHASLEERLRVLQEALMQTSGAWYSLHHCRTLRCERRPKLQIGVLALCAVCSWSAQRLQTMRTSPEAIPGRRCHQRARRGRRGRPAQRRCR